MDQATFDAFLDQPVNEHLLHRHLGMGKTQATGIDCDTRAITMTMREAINALLGLAKPLPDIDSVAFSQPQRIPAMVDQYAAVMVLRAVADCRAAVGT